MTESLTVDTAALFDAPMTPPAGVGRDLESRVGTQPAGGPKPRRNRKSAAVAAPDISENQFLADVRQLAKLTGWELYHTWCSKRSDPGFPDIVACSTAQRRTLFVELKTRTGRVSADQRKWLDLLAACGQEVAVWRPADMPEIAKILRGQRIGGTS